MAKNEFNPGPIENNLKKAKRWGAVANVSLAVSLIALLPGGLSAGTIGLGFGVAHAIAREAQTKHMHYAFNAKKAEEHKRYIGRTLLGEALSKGGANLALVGGLGVSLWESRAILDHVHVDPFLLLETPLLITTLAGTLATGLVARSGAFLLEERVYRTALEVEIAALPTLGEKFNKAWARIRHRR